MTRADKDEVTKVRTHSGDAPGDRGGGEAIGAHGRDPAFDVLGCDVGDVLAHDAAECCEVASIGVDGLRRPAGLKGEQEALDVGVGGSHGARSDSPGATRLLSPRTRRRAASLGALVAASLGTLAVLTGGAGASAAAGPVLAFPSSQSIAATGALPKGGSATLAYNTAIGERESAIVVVSGAERVAVEVAAPKGGLGLRLFFARFVSVAGRPVPDLLEPWDGRERATERAHQPLHVQVDVPYGTRPGRYASTITVVADGRRTALPVSVRVFPVTLPRPGSRVGNLLTSFNVSPESYVSKSTQLYGFSTHEQRIAANRELFALLGSSRVSPASWGFGEPRGPGGYESSSKWWLDSAGNFLGQLRASQGFSALRIPISSNRAAAHNYIADMSPFQPEAWCDYLRRIRAFWSENEVLGGSPLAYVFGYDEPGLAGQRLVARQAKAVHSCFEGGAQLMTGNPSNANAFLWDGRGGDDLDVWSVLSRRFYGRWTSPVDTREGRSRAREYLSRIESVRRRGKMVWAYTYTGTPGTPGFAATEPLSNPRMLLLWTALEGVQGLLYAQGVTSYAQGNPLDSPGNGEKVLLYPGSSAPMPSARLEQIRDGTEDWAIFDQLRKRRGAGAVRAILGNAGLFSADRSGVRLACTLGCPLKSSTKYAWPRWSRDSSTPRRIEAAKLAALKRL